jgi:hypothetical protein
LVDGGVFGVGFYFGSNIEEFVADAEKVATAVVVSAMMILGYVLYRKRRERVDRAIERMEQESEPANQSVRLHTGDDATDSKSEGMSA